MHRCLQITEILDQIIGALDTPRDFAEECRTPYSALAALAATSKVFLDPCLDLLWRDLESLVPIFVALGVPMRFFIELDRQTSDISCMMTHDEFGLEDVDVPHLLAHADMARASRYLRRIEQLRTCGSELTPILFACLSTAIAGSHTPFLPNLRRIFWDIAGLSNEQNGYVIFGSPQVTRLAFYTMQSEESVARSFPNLTEIEILPSSLWGPDPSALSRLVTSFASLCALDCDMNDISLEGFSALAAMPALHQLRVYSLPSDVQIPVPAQHRQPSQPFFPALSELNIRSISVHVARSFLEALDAPRLLRRLSFGGSLMKQQTDPTPELLFSCIGALCSPDTLLELSIDMWSILLPDTCTFYDALRHLRRYTRLEKCLVSGPLCSCDDALIESVASAYPRLTTLKLRPFGRDVTGLTLRSLYLLAKHCPRLERIQLGELTAPAGGLRMGDLKRTWDHDAHGRGGRLPPLDIRFAAVDASLVAQARAVAALVKDLFPNVVSFSEWAISHYIERGLDAEEYEPSDELFLASTMTPFLSPERLAEIAALFTGDGS